MAGLEILRIVAQANADAFDEELDEELDQELREGVPVEMWRAAGGS